ncbi:MAG: KpsF/GutQ family sugar-phosphate isomerase [bacterium]|nr:KpsF/GutQ family sugar-phosphate isomerase [bacterium]
MNRLTDTHMPDHARWLDVARGVLNAEAAAISEAVARVDAGMTRAIETILAHSGKVVVTGLGKSGLVGQKIVATLCSTGTPAVFLHASEAFHGDLGIYTPGDPTILLSKSGTTAELLRLVPILREFESPLIGILGNTESPLAKLMDIVIDGAVRAEADVNNLAPTSSTTLAMALGDALAVSLVYARGFTEEDFARYHPGGQLGRNMRLRVRDVMHQGEQVAWVTPDQPVKQIVIAMTQKPLGAACVMDDTRLIGLITDGDLRRALTAHDDIRALTARDIMTPHPITVSPGETLKAALVLMENRTSQISVLPVVDPAAERCLGLIRVHDIYHEG